MLNVHNPLEPNWQHDPCNWVSYRQSLFVSLVHVFGIPEVQSANKDNPSYAAIQAGE